MPSLKRAPSGSPAKAGPRGSSDSPAKATPPPAQRLCQSVGINGTGLGFNALSASADSAAAPGQRSPPHPANASPPPATRLYSYSWRARDSKRVMQSYEGRCAMRDSLEQNVEPLRAMYKELRASFGLTTTPPKGTKKKELVRELEELRHRAQVRDGHQALSAANAFEEVLAVKAATTNRELTDFSIIKFAKHWREAIGVAILRGAAAVVAQAAPMGAEEEGAAEEDETAASQEHSPDAR